MLEVHLGVAFALVTASKLTSTKVAGEGLLAGVSANVSGEVVAATERAHADAALEGLVARMDPQVARELVRAREPPVAVFGRAGVGALVDWGLTGPVGVLSRPYGFEGESLRLVMMMLGNMVLLCTQKAWLQLLLVLERPDSLEWRYRRWIDPKRLNGLERLVLHSSGFACATLVLEQVVIWDHGEQTGIHRFGSAVVLGGSVGQRG